MKLGSEPCRVCGKKVALYIPKGGDGSAYFLKRHVNQQGQRCDGSKSIEESRRG